MADIATTASEKTSNDPAASSNILVRLEALADELAEAGEPMIYYLKDEEEAAHVLLAMAAMIKITAKDVRNATDKSVYVGIARSYRKAVRHGNALETFRKMTEEDQLEFAGLELRANRIVLQ